MHKLHVAQALLKQADYARNIGNMTEAERLHRKVVAFTEAQFGLDDIVTAAALLDLVRILEARKKNQEASLLRARIRHILDHLDLPKRNQAAS